jgi:hypothetical protein
MELIDYPNSAASNCGVVESGVLNLPFPFFGSCWSNPPSLEARGLREESSMLAMLGRSKIWMMMIMNREGADQVQDFGSARKLNLKIKNYGAQVSLHIPLSHKGSALNKRSSLTCFVLSRKTRPQRILLRGHLYNLPCHNSLHYPGLVA